MSRQLKGWLRRQFAVRRFTMILALALAGALTLELMLTARTDAREWAAQGSPVDTVSVMTFNVLLGGKPAADALDAIEAAAADVVCLQEMTPELAAAFKARLSERYPHRYFRPGRMTQGVGIASRYPLSNGNLLTLGLTYLPAVAATVRLKSGKIRVACVHLMPPIARFKKSVGVRERYFRNERIRVGQVKRLLKHMNAAGLPAIILGDMNEWRGATALSRLTAGGFADACDGRGARCGPTWPGAFVPLPAMFRIDHILGRGVRFTDAAVLEAGGSDHYPVAARAIIGPRQLVEGIAQ